MKKAVERIGLVVLILVMAVLSLSEAVAKDVVVQEGAVDVNDLNAERLITTKDLIASGSITAQALTTSQDVTAQDVDASGTVSAQDVDATGDITAGGKVGIGTASPSEELDVVGDMAVSVDGSVGGDMTVTGDLIAGGFQTPTRYCEFQSTYDDQRPSANCELYFLGPQDINRMWYGFFGDGEDGGWEPAFGIYLKNNTGQVIIEALYGDGVLRFGEHHIDMPSTHKLRFNDSALTINHDGTNARMDYGDTEDDVLRLSGVVSALNFIPRTSVYDKSKGKALDWIKDSSAYKDSDGKIKHSEFYGYIEQEVTDYDKPEVEEYDELRRGKGGKQKIVKKSRTVYPHKKTEEAVGLCEEIGVLRQAIYELKQEVQRLKER